MATRTFKATVIVTVTNEVESSKKEMCFQVSDLSEVLQDLVVLELEEDCQRSVGTDDNEVTGVSIDWDTLKEVK